MPGKAGWSIETIWQSKKMFNDQGRKTLLSYCGLFVFFNIGSALFNPPVFSPATFTFHQAITDQFAA